MELAPLMMLSPLLLFVAYSDLRYMRIPNAISILAVLVFVASAFIIPVDNLLLRLVAAGMAFAIGFLGFSFRIVGGGDVKILAALFLFIPASGLQVFMYVFSATLVLGVGLILVLRSRPFPDLKNWKSVSGSHKFPMGISIAAAGLAHPYVMAVVH